MISVEFSYLDYISDKEMSSFGKMVRNVGRVLGSIGGITKLYDILCYEGIVMGNLNRQKYEHVVDRSLRCISKVYR